MRHMGNNRGFTLIELMVVVLILGILVAIGLPNFVRMSGNARRASCFANQRNVGEQSLLYAADQGIVTGNFNVNELLLANYVNSGMTECPESPNIDEDDYNISIVDGRVSSITCTYFPVRHQYTFPD